MQSKKKEFYEETLEDKLDKLIEKMDTMIMSESNQSYNKEIKLLSKLEVLEASLISLEKRVGHIVEEKITSFHDRLIEIFNAVSSDREMERTKKNTNERIAQDDRKRLKERLKEAVETKDSTEMTEKNITWMEYMFGIRKADGRLGKERIRLISSLCVLLSIFASEHEAETFGSAQCVFLVLMHFAG